MEVLLPHGTQDKEYLCKCAIEIGCDEFVANKFVFTVYDADLDVFQLMGDERLTQLVYVWTKCLHYAKKYVCNYEKPLDGFFNYLLKRLAHYSVHLWFSKEWADCDAQLKAKLLFHIKKAQDILKCMPDLQEFDWNRALKLGPRPWNYNYLQKFSHAVQCQKIVDPESVETDEDPADEEDKAYLKTENLSIAILRVMKLFDAGCMKTVMGMSMRIIAAWNAVNGEESRAAVCEGKTEASERNSLMLLAHLYLMATYEHCDERGFEIDNLISNVHFYSEAMNNELASKKSKTEATNLTPALIIAQLCRNLGLTSNDFIEWMAFGSFDASSTTLFGVIYYAYKSYILGNMLMSMNRMNKDDFDANLAKYKRTLSLYVTERERSELFMLAQLRKNKLKTTSQKSVCTVADVTDFKTHICKGNRSDNITAHNNHSDEDNLEKSHWISVESEKCCDSVFQNIPNNEIVLNQFYDILSKRSYTGWHFSKLIILLKIIKNEMHEIEKWRYHPGLTTEFMVNLERKLATRFMDLADIFQDHPFMEQEFWLTAFYLDPCEKTYSNVNRCGMRYNRILLNASKCGTVSGGLVHLGPGSTFANVDKTATGSGSAPVAPARDRSDKNSITVINAKYGLLSSTFDVEKIVQTANTEAPKSDYEPLRKALKSLRLPENIIKDLMTVTFSTRSGSFSWVVEWSELRGRCKQLLKDFSQKRHLIELNMAEANDHLKFLEIDYDKYRHRPQLDYGSIEEGYEDDLIAGDSSEDDDEVDDDTDEGLDDDADADEECAQMKKPKISEKNFDKVQMEIESEINLEGTRRTRSRTAAVIAKAMLREDCNKKQREKQTAPSNEEKESIVKENSNQKKTQSEIDQKVNDSESASKKPDGIAIWSNKTPGFKPVHNIWNLQRKSSENKVSSLVRLKPDSTITRAMQCSESFSLNRISSKFQSRLQNKMGSQKGPTRNADENIGRPTEKSVNEESDSNWDASAPSLLKEVLSCQKELFHAAANDTEANVAGKPDFLHILEQQTYAKTEGEPTEETKESVEAGTKDVEEIECPEVTSDVVVDESGPKAPESLGQDNEELCNHLQSAMGDVLGSEDAHIFNDAANGIGLPKDCEDADKSIVNEEGNLGDESLLSESGAKKIKLDTLGMESESNDNEAAREVDTGIQECPPTEPVYACIQDEQPNKIEADRAAVADVEVADVEIPIMEEHLSNDQTENRSQDLNLETEASPGTPEPRPEAEDESLEEPTKRSQMDSYNTFDDETAAQEKEASGTTVKGDEARFTITENTNKSENQKSSNAATSNFGPGPEDPEKPAFDILKDECKDPEELIETFKIHDERPTRKLTDEGGLSEAPKEESIKGDGHSCGLIEHPKDEISGEIEKSEQEQAEKPVIEQPKPPSPIEESVTEKDPEVTPRGDLIISDDSVHGQDDFEAGCSDVGASSGEDDEPICMLKTNLTTESPIQDAKEAEPLAVGLENRKLETADLLVQCKKLRVRIRRINIEKEIRLHSSQTRNKKLGVAAKSKKRLLPKRTRRAKTNMPSYFDSDESSNKSSSSNGSVFSVHHGYGAKAMTVSAALAPTAVSAARKKSGGPRSRKRTGSSSLSSVEECESIRPKRSRTAASGNRRQPSNTTYDEHRGVFFNVNCKQKSERLEERRKRKFEVTPRSASGMKVRISSVKNAASRFNAAALLKGVLNEEEEEEEDCIEISSGLNDSSMDSELSIQCAPGSQIGFVTNVDDPLFEEEMIIV